MIYTPGWMMEYFIPGSNMSIEEAYLYGFGVIASSALYTFTHHPYFFGVMHTGMKIRIAACSLLYRKVGTETRSYHIGEQFGLWMWVKRRRN